MSPYAPLEGSKQVKFSVNEDILGLPNGTIKIYTNMNNGTFQPKSVTSTSQNNFIAFGKLNNDYFVPDMVGFQGGVYNAIHRFYNDGNNNFTQQYPDFVPPGYQVDAIALVDLDDYWLFTPPELIVCGQMYDGLYRCRLWVFNNNGSGSFDAYSPRLWVDLWTGSYPPNWVETISDMAFGDFNDDDYPDIAFCSGLTLKVLMSIGPSNPGYLQDNNQPQLNQGYYDKIEVMHYNNDRFPDLVLSSGEENGTDLHVYQNTGIPGNQYRFETQPVWVGTISTPPDYVDDLGDLIAADITGTGALSLMCTGHYAPGPPYGFWVFKNHSDPRSHHPTNVQVEDCGIEHHPLIKWKPNEEDDLASYNVYRALMEDETPPSAEDFEQIATVTESQYIDNEVYMTEQYANYKIWYYVTAVDAADQESLPSNFIRFWGFYRPESEGPGALISGVMQPHAFAVSAYPNPFNPSTTINFTLPEMAKVTLNVYDVQGRQVAQLVNGLRQAGNHQVTFDGSNLASGVYLYTLKAGSHSATGKMMLMK